MDAGCQIAFSDYTPPEYIREAGGVVEEAGFDALWVPEHVLFFSDYASQYPYSEDGRLPGDPKSLLDPFSALTVMAATTRRIKLCTGVCLVPQRNPVYCAKQVADLDYLSGGRFEFGMGIGWLKEEFAALGIPWAGRADRLVECVKVMQALWGQENSSHEGALFQFKHAFLNPKPVQKPHPPIIFGGESRAALQRVATLGQGWYGFNLSPQRFEDALNSLDVMLTAEGRSLTDLRLYLTPDRDSQSAEALKAFEALGAQQIILPLFANDTARLKDRARALLDRIKTV